MRRLAEYIALLLIVVVFVEVIGETVPRLAELPDYVARTRSVERGLFVLDDAAGYVMQPHYVGRWSAPDYDEPFETNAHGLRGAELGAKNADEFRIVVVGDSMVFGGQVPENARFTERLEDALHLRGLANVRVVNAGVPGWTTFNEAGYLASNRSWLQPDLVVLAVYLGNDIEENVMATIGGYTPDAANGVAYGQRTREVVRNSVEWFPHNFGVGAVEYAQPALVPSGWKLGDPLPAPVGNAPLALNNGRAAVVAGGIDARTWLKQNSRVYRTMTDAWFNVRHGYARPIPLSLDTWLAFTLRDVPPQYAMQIGIPLTERYLQQARDTSHAAGADFVALLIPHDAEFVESKRDTELGRYHLALNQVELDRAERELQEWSANHGVQTIDLLPSLRARADRAELTYARDLHFTPLGHQVVAQILADELQRLGAIT